MAVSEQRERHAAKARKKVEARREEASGAAGPARARDDAYVDDKYEEVRRSIQSGMDALARRRVFPVFG